jgi:hypothetical protein
VFAEREDRGGGERGKDMAEREGLSPKLVKSHLFQALVMEDPG